MRRALIVLFLIATFGSGLAVAENRNYTKPIESVWDAAIKAVRDVDFVLLDSNRMEHEFEMRTKSWYSHKTGMTMEVTLVATSDSSTTISVTAADPERAKKLAKHIAEYLVALDERMD
ncbi:MAG: hypothetical protein GY906_09880 [bacterium]|nr:hypothetical protein [bacterium]